MVRRTLYALALTFLLTAGIALSASAQETQPGDACSQQHAVTHVGGPENAGTGFLLVCDGSNWQRVFEWDTSTGRLQTRIDADSATCDSSYEGAIRYNNNCIEVCDGTNWTCPGGGGVLDDLDDVNTAGVTEGASLRYISSEWVAVVGGNPACGTVSFTSAGTHSYTVPVGYNTITMRLWGGGGAGGTAVDSNTCYVAGNGEASTISSLGITAGGGTAGECGRDGNPGDGGAGGAAVGGDVNTDGEAGGNSNGSSSGAGGSSPNGGSGGAVVTIAYTDGFPGTAPGAGGSGGVNRTWDDATGGGGGAGAYVEVQFSSGELVGGASVTDIVVGGGGAPNTGGGNAGGAGAVGRVSIACYEAPQPPPPPPPAKRVFVTATTYQGDLGGVLGADAICQLRANGAGLGGTYMAWIADQNASSSPNNRFTTKYAGEYQLVDGQKVADNWADLTDGTIDTEIDLDANGSAVSGAVWTNVAEFGDRDGSSTTSNCSNWSSTLSGNNGAVGSSSSTSSTWTNDGSDNCFHNANSLYCFEQ